MKSVLITGLIVNHESPISSSDTEVEYKIIGLKGIDLYTLSETELSIQETTTRVISCKYNFECGEYSIVVNYLSGTLKDVLNGKKSDKDIVIDKWCPIHSESDLPLTKSFIGVTSSILLENKLRLDFEFPSLDFRVKFGHSIKLRNTPFLLHDKDTAISLFKNTFKEEDSYIYEYKDVYVVDYGNTSDIIKLPKECSYLALNSEGEYLKTLYLHRNLNGLSYTNPHTFKNLKNVYVDGIILDRNVLNSLFKFLQLASGINRGVVLSGAGYKKITEKYMRDVASNTGKIELDVNGIKVEFRFDLNK